MPYSKQHKQQTRTSILQSAYKLFANNGFEGTTLNSIMQDCSLTHGAFYAHFKSKSELYQQALKYAAQNSMLAKNKPENIHTKKWLNGLLDIYLSLEHVKGVSPCPLAFLATDIVSRDSKIRDTYSRSYQQMNKIILSYAGINGECSEAQIYSLTAMIIGAVAIARTIDDEQTVITLLSACRQQAQQLLETS